MWLDLRTGTLALALGLPAGMAIEESTFSTDDTEDVPKERSMVQTWCA